MKIQGKNKKNLLNGQQGFSVPELVIVLLILAIISVLALPQILSSRELFRFSGAQRQVITQLREARQQSMSQRKPITFRYDHGQRRIVLFGGRYGAAGSPNNYIYNFADEGLVRDDVEYGRPAFASTAVLGDGTDITNLTSNQVEFTFRPDGSVLDASDNPEDNALFFFHKGHQSGTAFAVSVLGSGGRVKVWRYSEGVNQYVE